jgi:hypothetical protein
VRLDAQGSAVEERESVRDEATAGPPISEVSTMRVCVVTRGVIDIPTGGLREQREVERRSSGSGVGGRTLKYSRRYKVGDRVELEAHEAERLAGLGIVRFVV